ncbi:hypothetical protein QNM96_19035 [Halostagnicola sp. A-GB9-2]|nr:hypothetical protein [Halostagnicola sp. A-GB9-2]MDJ1434133.1 hypothetical protein [Halostagnicola sp. A-GB9-2]
MLGISEDVSGRELADHALEDVETHGGDIYFDVVEHIDKGEVRASTRSVSGPLTRRSNRNASFSRPDFVTTARTRRRSGSSHR